MNSRIGSIVCHLFLPKGKPEAPRAGIFKGSQSMITASPLKIPALNTSDFCNVGVNDEGAVDFKPSFLRTINQTILRTYST